MANVAIDLGKYSYDIEIGAASWCQLGDWIATKQFSKQALLVSDDHVGPLYGEPIIQLLLEQGIRATLSLIPEGEQSKNLQQAEALYTQAIKLGLDRNSVIIALGGGVIGDLAGFVAATYLRGVPFIQIPTSLLAQVDSSVGGKVAVDHPLGKNLIGAFYQPQHVHINLAVLKTLAPRQFAAGMAEVIKYGLLADTLLFTYLEEHYQAILAQDEAALAWLIHRCCEIKSKFVSADEREQGIRIALNLGHTIGHAVEAASCFHYLHGEAVAIGLVGICYISELLGLIDKKTTERLTAMLHTYGLPLAAPGFKQDELISYMHRDKKSFDGTIRWILLSGIGQWTIKEELPASLIAAALARLTANDR
jgi:3-dehydroquinate synthase